MTDFLMDKVASNVIHVNSSYYFLKGHPMVGLVPNPLLTFSLQQKRVLVITVAYCHAALGSNPSSITIFRLCDLGVTEPPFFSGSVCRMELQWFFPHWAVAGIK